MDNTLEFLARGYDFASRRCDREHSDVARVRLLGRPAVLVRGAAAARLLYERQLFSREGALPTRVRRTLTGVGGVQGLDGPEHRHRKQLFVDLLDQVAAARIGEAFAERWPRELARSDIDPVPVLDTASVALCAVVSDWLGLPVPEGAPLRRRTRDLRSMIESGARVGPAHWRGRIARRRAERVLCRTVRAVRSDPDAFPERLRAFAEQDDMHGTLLDDRIVAVELLNVLRPSVAIARYVAFTVHALATRPELRDRLAVDPDLRRSFVHEVRRYYPFFPMAAAVSRTDVSFGDQIIPAGHRVLLDLYGTNRHRGDHERAEEFVAERYLLPPGEFGLVAQGGGDVRGGHRCPGEPVTVAVMEAALKVLLDGEWSASPGPIDPGRIPTAPAGGQLIRWFGPAAPDRVTDPVAKASVDPARR